MCVLGMRPLRTLPPREWASEVRGKVPSQMNVVSNGSRDQAVPGCLQQERAALLVHFPKSSLPSAGSTPGDTASHERKGLLYWPGSQSRRSLPSPSSQPELGWSRCSGASPTPATSASGPAGALQDLTLSKQTHAVQKDVGVLTAIPTAPEPTSTDTIAASTSIVPARAAPEEGAVVYLSGVEPGFTTQEKETIHPPSETTLHPTTHRASTARATTAQGPGTLHPHRAVQPDHHKTSVPVVPDQLLDPHPPSVADGGPSATEKAAEDGASTQLPAGEGSGEQVSVCPLESSVFPGTWGGRMGWLLVPGRAQCVRVR